jgi:hypothetical protein
VNDEQFLAFLDRVIGQLEAHAAGTGTFFPDYLETWRYAEAWVAEHSPPALEVLGPKPTARLGPRPEIIVSLRRLRDRLRGEVPAEFDTPEEQRPRDPTLFQLGNWDLTESGFVTYRGIRFPLERTPRRLLARLVGGRGRAVHADHLIDFADLSIDRGDLPPHISRLRQHLRNHLKSLDLPADPIPHADPDAYRLDLF